MKRTTDVDDGAGCLGAVGCLGIIALAASIFGPLGLLILVFLVFLACWAAASEHSEEADNAAARAADALAEQWRASRRPGEKGIEIAMTLNPESANDTPVTRRYRYELEEEDYWPLRR